jgi:hypothetical protein
LSQEQRPNLPKQRQQRQQQEFKQGEKLENELEAA